MADGAALNFEIEVQNSPARFDAQRGLAYESMIVKEFGISQWVLLPVSLAILVCAGLITTAPAKRESVAARV